MKFNTIYFSFATLLFIIEVLIALYVSDGFVRPYLGDVLVVILIYCFIRSFCKLPVLPLAIGVLLFAFTIEFLQYLRIVERLGLQESKMIRIVLGTSFVWNDMIAYSAGAAIIVIIENLRMKWQKKTITTVL